MTKVRVSVGATINVGDFNSARVTIELESEFSDMTFPEKIEIDKSVVIEEQVNVLYAQAEDQLVHKMAALINRLESVGYIGG